MAEMTNWDRASDLLGLIHAASFLADDARRYPDAQHGLSAVLNVAQRYAEAICTEAEMAERATESQPSEIAQIMALLSDYDETQRRAAIVALKGFASVNSGSEAV